VSRLVIFDLLHGEVIRLLESWGERRLASEVEKAGESHDVYTFLDKAFSMYYAEYGGINCRWLREELQRDWDRVVGVVLPALLRQYLSARRRGGKGGEGAVEELRASAWA